MDPLTAARIQTVRDHMRLECEHDWDGVIAPTGKAFRVRMMASFEFAPDTAMIVCERPYYDRRAVMSALGLG